MNTNYRKYIDETLIPSIATLFGRTYNEKVNNELYNFLFYTDILKSNSSGRYYIPEINELSDTIKKINAKDDENNTHEIISEMKSFIEYIDVIEQISSDFDDKYKFLVDYFENSYKMASLFLDICIISMNPEIFKNKCGKLLGELRYKSYKNDDIYNQLYYFTASHCSAEPLSNGNLCWIRNMVTQYSNKSMNKQLDILHDLTIETFGDLLLYHKKLKIDNSNVL